VSGLPRPFWPIIILWLAFVLRVAAIGQIPPGLTHDEANNGMAAIQTLNGQPQIFYDINKGIEPLIIYLEALAFAAFGIGPVQLRLVNVFCGLLTVALIYPLTARLFNRRAALLAMTGTAIFFWPVFVSRLTLRAILLPPLLMAALYALWYSLREKNPRRSHYFFAASGLVSGIAMYTYLSSRFVPLLALSLFGWQLLRKQIKRRHGWGLLLYFAVWIVVITPLGRHYWQNRVSFSERSSQVTTIPYLLNGEFGPTVQNTLRTLGMFTFHGDDTDRYNLDGRPLFDWLNGALFYLGLGLLLFRLGQSPRRAGPASLLWLWLLVMLLPDFITDDSPHFLRVIGALPAITIIWAIGLEYAYRQISVRLNQPSHRLFATRRIIPSALLALLLGLTTLHTIYDYFFRWANAAEARHIYGADIAQIARHLQNDTDDALPVISSEYYLDLDQFRLALHSGGNPPFAFWFDGEQSLALPPPDSGLLPRYLFSAATPPPAEWQSLLLPVAAASGRDYSGYQLAANATTQLTGLFDPKTELAVNINNDLLLENYRLLGNVVSGGKFHVLLNWQVLRPQPPDADYTFVMELRDPQGHVWAIADGNGYPPRYWQPGVQALQLLTARLPGDLPPRAFTLTVQVVDRRAAVALPTAAGQTVIPLTEVTARLDDHPDSIALDRLPNPNESETLPQNGPPLILRGYRVEPTAAKSDDTLTVTLHWETRQQPQTNYNLRFRVMNDTKILYEWPPLAPIGGEWPTGQWPAGYWVQDRINLTLPRGLPPGQMQLWGEWVQSDTGLPETDTDRGFELGWLTVE
jgi:4-amino-4-deoxy-L-arabinose transferase-like glycosyltransferase